MKMHICFTRWPILMLIAATLCLPLSTAQAGKLYKWVDENGRVRYGDRIPPQYAKQQKQTLNDQGIVVETKAAAKTRAQLAEEARLAKIKAEEEKKRREQAHKDRILLDTFTNEDEMIMTRDGKIEAIEAIIRITTGRIEKTKKRLSDLNQRAANLERTGKPVPDDLKQQISDTHAQIQQNQDYIKNRKLEQHTIREKFAADIKRFRELKTAEANTD